MIFKKALISIATAAAVVAGGSFAIAQTTGTQGPASESSASGAPGQGTGSGMGSNAGQGTTGTGTGTGMTGQSDSMGRTGSMTARTDRN